MEVSDEDHSIRFADGATLDLSGLTSIKTFNTNYSVKGLKKVILPTSVENILFTDKFGDGVCDIRNIWSNESYHESDNFEGIDFRGMRLDTIDLQGLTYIENGLNFNILSSLVPPLATASIWSTSKITSGALLPQYWHVKLSLLKTSNLNFFDIGFLLALAITTLLII